MTARLVRRAVLARTAEALAQSLAHHRPVELGQVLGRAHTTAPRWADDLTAWPAADLLTLACADEHLAHELRAALDPTPIIPHPLDAERDLRSCVSHAGGAIQRAMAALEDGRLDFEEIPPLLVELRELQESLIVAVTDLNARLQGQR
jgi:hypothetical protein